MTLTDVLEQIRSVYLEEFAQRLAGYPDDVRRVMLAEALYVDADGSPIRTGALKLPARGDLCVLQEQKIQEIARIESSRTVQFDGFRFVWNDQLQIALNPFSWSNCAFCIPEPPIAIDYASLAAWFEVYVSPEQAAAMDATQLLQVAHSMSAPRWVRFEIDFGSMPVAGFEALLDACGQTGAGLVVIGNPAIPER